MSCSRYPFCLGGSYIIKQRAPKHTKVMCQTHHGGNTTNRRWHQYHNRPTCTPFSISSTCSTLHATTTYISGIRTTAGNPIPRTVQPRGCPNPSRALPEPNLRATKSPPRAQTAVGTITRTSPRSAVQRPPSSASQRPQRSPS